MTATESLLPEIINDFFNKICQQRSLALANSITSSAQYSSFAEREVMECWPKMPPSLRLDAREPDNLAPLLGLVSDEFPEVGGRARNHRRA